MKPERWQQISRIFKSAISLDGEARAAYIAGECGVDESLRGEVEKLIASHQHANAEKFIDDVAAEAGAVLLIENPEIAEKQRVLEIGQQLGAYVISEALGAGGMGEVYLAKDTRLDRSVALKVLSSDISADKRRMQRFRQEARVASSLNQPNILTVFEFGEVEGLTFLATEYVAGETLRNRLYSKRLKLGEILDITIQILAALDAAHEARIVHRDIKPENVMIRSRDSVVKVLDFGLAKVTDRASATQRSDLEAATEFKTAPGRIMGTINYMSPEQAQGHPVNERTDLWSTGVILYEMIAGVLPFSGPTSSHTIVQILEREPAPLITVADRNVPPELERIVTKAIAKNPDERYQTAKDMMIDLRNLKKQLDIEVELERSSSPNMRRVTVATEETNGAEHKKRTLLIVIGGIVLVTAATFGVNIWRSSNARNTAVVTAPAPVSERRLTYWITVQKFRNGVAYQDPFTLGKEINFEADYQIRVSVRSLQSGYLYILNEGPPEASQPTEFVVAFPSDTSNNGASFLAANQVVNIPEESWLQFDKQEGTEKLWLVFSEEPVPELEAVPRANRRTRGLITDPAQNRTIQSFLLTHSSPQLEPERSDLLTTLKADGKLLVYPIHLEHH